MPDRTISYMASTSAARVLSPMWPSLAARRLTTTAVPNGMGVVKYW